MADVLPPTLSARPAMAAITIMGSGRLGPTITALVGLAAAVLGARALSRARQPGDHGSPERERQRRPGALLLGVAAVVLGVLFLVAADGGPGTGNGVVASAAAILLGSVAIGFDRLGAVQRRHSSG